jgi:hypothetical protein
MGKVFKNKSYQIWEENKCCVCGSTEEENLTIHHIVPSCYIYKINKILHKKVLYEFDFCCVCKECHIKCNKNYDTAILNKVLEKYNIDLANISYRKLHSNLPKPSTLVAEKIKTVNNYLELRNFCFLTFKEIMKPMFSVYGTKNEKMMFEVFD